MALKTFQLNESPLIKAEPLTPDSFASFGSIISPNHQTQNSVAANYGTAIKVLKVAPVTNTYHLAKSGEVATANWNIFRCSPPNHLITYGQDDKQNIYIAKVLERHPYSTQAFVPMGRDTDEIAYLVICGLKDSSTEQNLPDPTSVRAFICMGNQSVTYDVGTWHAPMIALKRTLDFGVLIHENGVPEEDCEECYFEPGYKIQFDL